MKINSHTKTHVMLLGGLGNQLFQLAAAFSIADGSSIKLNAVLGKPRTNDSGLPQIFCFNLPTNVGLDSKCRNSVLLTRLLNRLLRFGIMNDSRNSRFYLTILKIPTEAIYSLISRERRLISIGNGVGYSDLQKSMHPQFLVGYFQSYLWLYHSKTREVLKSMHALTSSILLKYSELATTEKPIVIHIRLTDYLKEQNFGVLSDQYFRDGLSELHANFSEDTLWIFSDDVQLAQSSFSFMQGYRVRWFDSVENCPAKTLDVMRLGHKFIISNSTYSWWAASLAQRSYVQTVAPSPWFKNLPEPVDLIDPNWTRVNASWRDSL
jgi:hypothetical protein